MSSEHEYPVLPLEVPDPRRPEREPYVLFVSTFEPRKNHLLAFEAWRRLIERRGLRQTPLLVCVGGRAWMVERIEALIAEWKKRAHIDRCGIGFGGPVLWETQRIATSTHVGGWADFDLPAYLEPVLGFRPIMDNDANVGALGEGIYGAGRSARPLYYLTVSTGIGSGILTADGIYRGADSFAGEVGHIVIRPDGPVPTSSSSGTPKPLE